MIKVSVILTTYNGEKSVGKTIGSIKSQEGAGKDFDLELIVVDDCSTDDTVKVLREHDVLLFSTDENTGGPNCGRNIGLKNAAGEYICIADQDDIWKENRIMSLLPFMGKAAIITSGYTVIDEANKRRFDRVNHGDEAYIYYDKNQTFIKVLTKSIKGQNTYLGSIVFSGELRNIKFEEEEGVVDFDWILRLFHNRSSIEVCDSLYYRYVDNGNLSLDENYREIDFNYSLKFIETFKEEYPVEVGVAIKKIHGSRARYYYVIGDMKKARYYFLKSNISLKTIAYYITTFVGSGWVKKRFHLFG